MKLPESSSSAPARLLPLLAVMGALAGCAGKPLSENLDMLDERTRMRVTSLLDELENDCHAYNLHTTVVMDDVSRGSGFIFVPGDDPQEWSLNNQILDLRDARYRVATEMWATLPTPPPEDPHERLAAWEELERQFPEKTERLDKLRLETYILIALLLTDETDIERIKALLKRGEEVGNGTPIEDNANQLRGELLAAGFDVEGEIYCSERYEDFYNFLTIKRK